MAKRIKAHLRQRGLFYVLPMLGVAIIIGLYFSLSNVWMAKAEVTGVTLADNDTDEFGLNGEDFTITWTPGVVPEGFQSRSIYITTSGINLVTSTLQTTGCSGHPCGSFGNLTDGSQSSYTLPEMYFSDSVGDQFASSSSYVAWIYTAAISGNTLVSSSPVSYASNYDTPDDINAPQIEHLSVYLTTESAHLDLYAFIYDDQTQPMSFANTGDGGAEYFKVVYGTDVSVASSTADATVVGQGNLFRLRILSGSVPVAGNAIEYYLVAKDRAGNLRFFCANPSANNDATCSVSPFIVTTVAAGSRTVSGLITQSAPVPTLADAYVFAGGWGGSVVTSSATGTYQITGLPNNSIFDFTAYKVSYCRTSRTENITQSNKTDINMLLSNGFCTYQSEGAGEAPIVLFSGPPDGSTNAPLDGMIRVGLDQTMNSLGIGSADAAGDNSPIYLTSDNGVTKVAGVTIWCANSSTHGCSSMPANDINTIAFVPTASLATSTQYSLVINNTIVNQSGKPIQGNRPGGGHVITFTTMGNQWAGEGFGQGGESMPPYVKSVIPGPGMNAAPNTNVVVEFNEAMSGGTITGSNILLYDKTSAENVSLTSIALDSNEKRFITIDPGTLIAGRDYEVRIKGAVLSAKGVPMSSNAGQVTFSSSFHVAGSADSTAPTVYPMLANNSTDVAVNTVFHFGFNEQLSVSTINTTNITLRRGATSAAISVKYDPGSNSVYVIPNSALVPGTVYTLTMTTAVKDLAGNGLASNAVYTYTTGSADTNGPIIKEARCDDFACKIVFNEPMNSYTQIMDAAQYHDSVLNLSNWTLAKTAPGSASISLTGKAITYDPTEFSVKISGGFGGTLVTGDTYRITASSTITDLSGNMVDTSSSQNIFSGSVESSMMTGGGEFGGGGMFVPPTMVSGTQAGAAYTPSGFGGFTPEQFAMGQADAAFPFNPLAGSDSNVFQVRFTPGVVLATGDQVVLTFPNGTTITGANFDTQSPYYADFNQTMAGTVTGTAIIADNTSAKITITLGVSGSPEANNPITIDLKKIINPAIPKGPSTGGYTVGIKVIQSGAATVNKTSMPYFVMAGGTNTLVIDVVAGANTSTPSAGANGTVYLFGGGPGGPMDKKLILTDGDIASVDGTGASSVTYSNLPNGCYHVSTEPTVYLANDTYSGQMSPEPVCLNGGETKTKWILLSSVTAGSNVSLVYKMVDANGDPFVFSSKDIDLFVGGPGRSVMRTLSGVTTTLTAGYIVKLNADGNWFAGMGPAMSKGTSGGMSVSLGVMPPPPVVLSVKNIDTTPVVAVAGGLPPGVSFNFSGGIATLTYTFAAANKTIAGTVKDGSGNGLANVEVFVSRQGFGMPQFTQTDAAGAFSLGVADYGNYEIGARKDGMPPVFKSIEVRSEGGTKIYMGGQNVTNNFVITLKKAAYTISGKLLDSNNNGIGYAPIMGVDANGNNVSGGTSSDGSYTLFVDNGTWTLRAELPPANSDSCGTFSKSVTVSGASRSSQNITPTVTTCYTLSGTLSVGGTGLANNPVFIEEWDSENSRPVAGGAKKPASTDSIGAYSVKVGTGTYRIGTWSPTYGELSTTVTVAGNTTKNLTVASTGSITFSFTGGTAAMNAFIELKNSTNGNQRFGKQVNGLNTSTVMAVEDGITFNYFIDVFGVGKFSGTAEAGDAETINLGVGGGFVTVTGTVYDGDDNAKSGALVTFSNASTTVSVVTDADGNYSASLKAGTYTLAESLAGHVSPQSASVSFTTNTAGYDFGGVSPDQSALAVAAYTVTGTVYASDGSTPMTEGYVWGTNASSTAVSSPVNATDGTYSLPVTNGVWIIKAVGPKHVETILSPAVTVSGASQSGKNITLTAAAAGANMSTSTAGIMTASTGGSLNDTAASGIKLTAGAGVLDSGSGDVTLNFEKNYTAPDTESFEALGNATFSITAEGGSSIKDLNGNAEITLDYTSLLSGLPTSTSEGSLQLVYYSPERDEYVPVEGGFTVDTANNTITGMVDHFTDFVIAFVATSEEAPSAPTGVTATAASASQINVSWTAVSGATFYSVHRSTDNVTYTDVATTTGTSYSDTGRTASTLYYYKMTASNASGESASSDAASATTNAAAPSGSSGSVSDTTPPTNTSIVIAAGATTTLNANVTLTLGATDASQMMIANTSAFTSSTWETYAATKSWTLTSGAGAKTVYAKFKDAFGNISTTVSDTVILSDSATTTTPVVTTMPVVVAPVVTAPVVQPTAPTAPVIVIANPESKISISDITVASYQPGAKLKFTYQYKNEGTKIAKIKIVRQLLNSKNKVIKTMTAYRSIKVGKVFKGVVDEVLPLSLPAGEYTEKITITNGKKIDTNSFKITIEKLKKKYLTVDSGSVGPGDINFKWVVKNGVQNLFGDPGKPVALPTTLKMGYTYTNNSGTKHTVKMVRELLGPGGKAIMTKTGRWVMKVGEADSINFTQSLAKYLDAGTYKIRVRAYDWTTKKLLAENSLGFAIELK